MSEAEVLDLGTDRAAGPRRRLWRLLLVAVVVVAAGGYVVERALRDRAHGRVVACADRVSAAVELEGRRVRATYEYVRFAAGIVDAQGQMSSLYLLIAKAARDSGPAFVSARDACANIAVLPIHDDLDDRRDQCVEVLDAQQSRLAAVAADGQAVIDWLDAPRSC